jgi:threonine/homoserine/homoserine lactone efflux protein
MIDLHLFAAFIAATIVLILIPGPNVALIVANSVAYGTRYGLTTVAGTCSAMVPQLALTVFGMAAVLSVMAAWFEWLRWIGVAYLIYLGISQWRAQPVDLTQTRPQPRLLRRIYLQAFMVSCANPKTLLFFVAFFPQFVSKKCDFTRQIVLLCVTFLVLAVSLDSCWAICAGRARRALARHGRLRNRITGGMLIGAAVGLAEARVRNG